MEIVSPVIRILSVLIVIAQATVVVLLILVFFKARSLGAARILEFIKKYALFAAFSIALVATLGSLFLSEVGGFAPCILCWYQRIFMYPQVILLLVALWKRDRGIAAYAFALSLLGGAISAFHYYHQLAPSANLPCSAVGFSVSCSQRFFMEFGYITIPLMAFSAFALIAVLMGLVLFSRAGGREEDKKQQSL